MNKKALQKQGFNTLNMVGVARFELATSRPPDARATKLRYTPMAINSKVGCFTLALCILTIYQLNATTIHLLWPYF